MEAKMVPPSDGVSGLRNHVERFHAIGAAKSKCTEELENQTSGPEERLEDNETEEDNTKKSVAGKRDMEGEDDDTDAEDADI